MLFHVVKQPPPPHAVDDLYHRKSLVSWGKALHDEDLVQAIVDRVLGLGESGGPLGRRMPLVPLLISTHLGGLG
jgi:hypothetical protein